MVSKFLTKLFLIAAISFAILFAYDRTIYPINERIIHLKTAFSHYNTAKYYFFGNSQVRRFAYYCNDMPQYAIFAQDGSDMFVIEDKIDKVLKPTKEKKYVFVCLSYILPMVIRDVNDAKNIIIENEFAYCTPFQWITQKNLKETIKSKMCVVNDVDNFSFFAQHINKLPHMRTFLIDNWIKKDKEQEERSRNNEEITRKVATSWNHHIDSTRRCLPNRIDSIFGAFKNIKKICDERGYTLITFTTPNYYKFKQIIRQQRIDSIMKVINTEVTQLNVPYFNYDTVNSYNNNIDYYLDPNHLNAKGSEVVLNRLISDVKKTIEK